MEALNKNQKKELQLIGKFTEVYCSGKHSNSERKMVNILDVPNFQTDLKGYSLCAECSSFLDYAFAKRLKCPLEANKPSCKHCKIHCYDSLHRDKVKEIMGYAGRKLLMRGRLDYLWHYFF